MASKSSKGMSVGRKLQIPNLLYLVLLVVVLVLFFSSNILIETLREKRTSFNLLAENVRNTAFSIQSFMSGDLSFEELDQEYGKLSGLLEGTTLADKFSAIRTSVERFAQLEKENAAIEKEITSLTETSVEQSNGYIKIMSEKLAGEDTRASVTTLERLVIMGASINTTSNFRLQVLFLKLKEDISLKDQILGFLDTLIDNTAKDMKSLANTPFSDMAKTAQTANMRNKELTLSFVKNVEEQKTIEDSIITEIEDVMRLIDKQSLDSSEEFFGQIKGYFQLNLVLIVLVTIIGIVSTWLIGRAVGSSISLIAEGARRFSIGDVKLAGMDWDRIKQIRARKDEIGDTGRAFAELINYLKEKAKAAEEIAEGNLDIEVRVVSDEDALGNSLRTMVKSLNEVLELVAESSDQVVNGSTQISDSSQSLSQGATEQAASLEEITSSMTELGAQTKSNAENAATANKLSGEARRAAETGASQMREMIVAMKDIEQSSSEIAKIIKAIDDIAFQTNLLALNAAVEAARAGKHGKGFAVVAQEVRNLAGRSAKAAQETADLIEGAVKKAGAGTEIVNRTDRSLAEIVSGITKVTDLVGEIADASNEQSLGISQINLGLSQIEQVTQQNTANAEETASASEELSGMAKEMSRLVSRFKLAARQGRDYHEPESEVRQASAFLALEEPDSDY